MIISEQMANYYYSNYYSKKRPIGYRNFYNKYGKYFEEAEDYFARRDGFDPYLFVKANMIEGFKWPQQLKVSKAWEDFERNKDGCKEESEGVSLAHEIVSGLKQLNGESVENFLKKEYNVYQIENNIQQFSIRAFMFSRTFLGFYRNNILKFKKNYNPSILRVAVFKYPKIIEKIKSILKEDYFEQNS